MAKFCSACGGALPASGQFCPECGARAGGAAALPAKTLAPPPRRSRARIWRVIFGITGAYAAALMISFAYSQCSSGAKSTARKPPAVQRHAPAVAPQPARAAPTPKAEPPRDPVAEYLALDDLDAALAISKPHMKDTTDEQSPGTLQLAMWAGNKMTLGHVKVATNETSVKRALKDSDSERGKRMCVRGYLIQIEKAALTGVSLFGVLFRTSDGGIVSAHAARSTGDLVEGSRARLCGVVTGRFSYANSGGGMGHAVHMVGVFDLPENR